MNIIKRTPHKKENREYTAKIDERYKYFKDFIKEVEEKYEILSLKVNEQFEARAENCFDSETFRKLLSLRTTQVQSMEFMEK